MRSSILSLLLPLLANGASIQHESRQMGGLLASMAPKTKAFKIEPLTPRNPSAKRIGMTWGPLKIRGANSTTKAGNSISMDGGGTGYNLQPSADFPTDITLLDGTVEIQGPDFKRVTLDENIYTHHFLVYDMGKPQRAAFALILGGAAEDAEAHYATIKIPGKKSGYHVKKDSPILMAIDVVNYNKDDMNVYASADMEYIEGQPADYLDVYPVFVPVTACDAGGIVPGIVQMPKGQSKWSLKSTGLIAGEDSVLFLFRGHMHDGGSNVEVKFNGKVVCDSKALYGGKGHVGKTTDGKDWETISDMVTCPEPGIVVKKGDKIDLTANFDVLAHPARESGHSGMLGDRLGGMLGGGGDGHAEQMAVSIIYVAPLK